MYVMEHKRLTIHAETYDILNNIRAEGQSFNGIIKELINMFREKNG